MTIGQKKMPRASALAPQAVSGVRSLCSLRISLIYFQFWHSISSTAGVITVPSCYMVCLLKKACQKEGSTVLKGLKINRGHLNLRTVDNMLNLWSSFFILAFPTENKIWATYIISLVTAGTNKHILSLKIKSEAIRHSSRVIYEGEDLPTPWATPKQCY